MTTFTSGPRFGCRTDSGSPWSRPRATSSCPPVRPWSERIAQAFVGAGRWAAGHAAPVARIGPRRRRHRPPPPLSARSAGDDRVPPESLGGDSRRLVMRALKLIERRARWAGRMRPPGLTLARWYGPFAGDAAGEPRAALDGLVTSGRLGDSCSRPARTARAVGRIRHPANLPICRERVDARPFSRCDSGEPNQKGSHDVKTMIDHDGRKQSRFIPAESKESGPRSITLCGARPRWSSMCWPACWRGAFARRRPAGPGQNDAGQGPGTGAGRQVRAGPVHARLASRRHHRVSHLRPEHPRIRVHARARLCRCASGR